MGEELDLRSNWHLDVDTFGARLLAVRRRMGWDQVTLADRIGVTRESVSAWETDRSSPRRMDELVEKIAQVTGCDPVWLMWGQSALVERGSIGLAGQDMWSPLTARAMIRRWISEVPSKIVYISTQDAAMILALTMIFETCPVIPLPDRSDDPEPEPKIAA